MPVYTDQIGTQIELKEIPKKIISLVPSQTELLYDLGLGDTVIGITKFCIHPAEWFITKTRIGGTKNVNIKKVAALAPDLIIASKEENVKEQIEVLQTIAPVWTSDISNLENALDMVEQIGRMTNQQIKAQQINERITNGFKQIQVPAKRKTVCYLIWREPYMTVGGDCFISHMLNRCGLQNIFEQEKRYPETTISQLQSLKPDYIFLSSEPYPFKEKHMAELKQVLPQTKVLLVDGEMFSWYGSRLQKSPIYFNDLLSSL